MAAILKLNMATKMPYFCLNDAGDDVRYIDECHLLSFSIPGGSQWRRTLAAIVTYNDVIIKEHLMKTGSG